MIVLYVVIFFDLGVVEIVLLCCGYFVWCVDSYFWFVIFVEEFVGVFIVLDSDVDVILCFLLDY